MLAPVHGVWNSLLAEVKKKRVGATSCSGLISDNSDNMKSGSDNFQSVLIIQYGTAKRQHSAVSQPARMHC